MGSHAGLKEHPLDIGGTPFRWLEPRVAVTCYAIGKVAWDLGKAAVVFRGGRSRAGGRTVIVARPVIALARSESMVKWARAVLPLGSGNTLLFKRDRFLCAYCGQKFPHSGLTRDHVLPKSRGGRDVWENVVTACRSCNQLLKRDRTPEEAHMPLVYLPYAPCRYEHFILSGRDILADQMDYLLAKVAKRSRLSA
jgi:hypothetical protein